LHPCQARWLQRVAQGPAQALSPRAPVLVLSPPLFPHVVPMCVRSFPVARCVVVPHLVLLARGRGGPLDGWMDEEHRKGRKTHSRSASRKGGNGEKRKAKEKNRSILQIPTIYPFLPFFLALPAASKVACLCRVLSAAGNKAKGRAQPPRRASHTPHTHTQNNRDTLVRASCSPYRRPCRRHVDHQANCQQDQGERIAEAALVLSSTCMTQRNSTWKLRCLREECTCANCRTCVSAVCLCLCVQMCEKQCRDENGFKVHRHPPRHKPCNSPPRTSGTPTDSLRASSRSLLCTVPLFVRSAHASDGSVS
jgi:hypothetical protein